MAKRKQPTQTGAKKPAQPTTKATPAVQDDVSTQEVTDVIELTDAIVKTKYERNANTNAFTDAIVTKIAGIENFATADQSDAEIETAYNAQVDIVSQAEAEAGTATTARRWTAQRVAQAIAALAGDGGGVSGDDFDLTSGAVTVKGEYIGTSAPVLTNPSAGVYLLTVPVGTRVISYSLFGNNTVLNGSNEFLVQINNNANGIQRSYGAVQYIGNTGARADVFTIGTSETISFPSTNVTQLLFPGMNGYGSTGFRIVLS